MIPGSYEVKVSVKFFKSDEKDLILNHEMRLI